MFGLINTLKDTQRGQVYLPGWDYVNTGLNQSLQHVITFYRQAGQAVPSDHILVSLLLSLGIPIDYDLSRYYQYADSSSVTTSMQLGLTSSLSRGRVLKGTFFNTRTPEILIAHDAGFDYTLADRHWEDLSPVEVLSHGIENLDYRLLMGKSENPSYAVIAVNVPMLAIQYRAFRQAQIRSGLIDSGVTESIMQFVAQYPLTNALRSSLDCVLFNRITGHLNHSAFNQLPYRHSFFVTDFTDRVDQIYVKLIEQVKNSSYDFATVLKTFPISNGRTLLDFMKLPDTAPTRQVNWATCLARLDLITVLVELAQDHGKRTNQAEVSNLKYELSVYLRDGTIQSALPVLMYDRVKYKIDKLLNML